MSYTDFTIVRHGESLANRQGLLQGWYESPLSENGVLQARAAAEYLKNRRFDIAFSSDLERAHRTLLEVAWHHSGLKVFPTIALREWHLGILEGKLQKELLQEFPDVMASFRCEENNVSIPQGESRDEFQKRIETFMREAAEKYPGKSILIGTHGGVLQRIFRMVTGPIAPGNIIPLPDNASVNMIRYYGEKKGWQLLSWNLCEHLRGLEIHTTLVH